MSGDLSELFKVPILEMYYYSISELLFSPVFSSDLAFNLDMLNTLSFDRSLVIVRSPIFVMSCGGDLALETDYFLLDTEFY